VPAASDTARAALMSADLPMPAGPSTTSRLPRPPWARATAASMRVTSASRSSTPALPGAATLTAPT
jgi:hypothetical protein